MTDRPAALSTLLTLLALVTLAAGCATPPLREPASEPLHAWSQFGPEGRATIRAIVSAGAACPEATIDGRILPLDRRAAATSPDSAGRDFAVGACELSVPDASHEIRVAGHRLPSPPADPQRIVVLGDTGCRIKVAANGTGDPIQDCARPDAWPWPRLAAAAAATRPDLVIHLGDYHYREYCQDPLRCRELAARGEALGYGWAGWRADFFVPAAPLLAAAPWVFVRGNHENCDRAGEGWMRFLSPRPYRPCEDPRRGAPGTRSGLGNNHTADAYRISLGAAPTLVIADNAGHEDWRRATVTPQDTDIFRSTLKTLAEAPAGTPLWFFSHRPIWYDLIDAANQPNAFQAVLAEGLTDKLQLAFGGHQHVFETINFARDADPFRNPAGRPAQVIVGGGGTQLEVLDPRSPFYAGDARKTERRNPDGRSYDGATASSSIVLNRYSFLLLERRGGGWNGSVIDPDGATITRCRLDGATKAFDCAFPSP